MHSLPLFMRLESRPVILIGEGEALAAKRRMLERAGARIVGEDAEAALAIVAFADDAADSAATRLKARGILVNVADRPELCDFTLPAIIDRDPVMIAVGTGGASAGLAKIIRQRIEVLLPATLGALAKALHAARPAMRERWPDPAERRRALDAALAAGGPLDPLGPLAIDAVDGWLADETASSASKLIDILLPSPDPDNLTLRMARLLGEADTVYHRADVPAEVLNRARADARRVPVDAPPAELAAGLSLYLRMN